SVRAPSSLPICNHPQDVAYDIQGWNLRVGVDTPDLLQCVDELYGSFRSAAHGDASWQISMRRGEFNPGDVPASARLLWSGVVPPGVSAANYVGPGFRRFDLIDRGSCTLDLMHREAHITMLPNANAKSAHYFLMTLLCTGLARTAHVPIHASCLAAKQDGKPCSVLIIAPSGTGKSTTSYGLTSGGWKLMGDDLSLLHVDREQVLAWGYPRHCHVRRPTFDLLPWLKEMPLTRLGAEETWQFPLRALGSRSIGPSPQILPAGLIVLLEKPNRTGHRCEQADPATAVSWICQENVQPIEGYTDPEAHAAFATIGQLVRQTVAIRVSAGPDVEQLADFLAAETGVTA
ncbi:MAG: hypothetical protein RIS70_2604, partial [Planctomycetota bacterium]